MKVLLVGSGGREHALAWAIAASPLVERLWCAPGNPGIATVATCVKIGAMDIPALVAFARENAVDLVVPGPEAPLVAGIADACAEAGIACFGPSAAAARLEGSKAFMKEICAAAGVANLELIDRLDLVRNAGETGAYFRSALAEAVADHKNVGEVRGDGMLAAVEFVADKDDRTFFDASQKIGPQIAAALLERGVIGRAMPQGDILGFAPPLCLTKEEADIVVERTADAIASVLDAL